jgi:hypothetical protein
MKNQEQEELWIFEKFVELFFNGRIPDFEKGESPDFIINLDGEKIGIELTEVFQDSSYSYSKLQQNSSDWANFTDQFIAAIQSEVDFKFSVGIHFSRFHEIKKSDKVNLIEKLKELCIPHLRTLPDRRHLKLDFYNGIPQQIDSIDFGRLDGIADSFNYKPEGGPVSDLKIEHLTPILLKKEKKLGKYVECDKNWLLIREGNYYAGSFSELDVPTPIESSFDKVFLLRTRKSSLVELK